MSLERMPRMADFAEWVCAAEPSLPWEAGSFLCAYETNRKHAAETMTENDEVAVAVLEMELRDRTWEGTATELLDLLKEGRDRPGKGWPASVQSLSKRLRRAEPGLRRNGIGIEFDVRSPDRQSRRLIRISRGSQFADRADRADRSEAISVGSSVRSVRSVSRIRAPSRDDEEIVI